jgi:hypothetical protein
MEHVTMVGFSISLAPVVLGFDHRALISQFLFLVLKAAALFPPHYQAYPMLIPGLR